MIGLSIYCRKFACPPNFAGIVQLCYVVGFVDVVGFVVAIIIGTYEMQILFCYYNMFYIVVKILIGLTFRTLF